MRSPLRTVLVVVFGIGIAVVAFLYAASMNGVLLHGGTLSLVQPNQAELAAGNWNENATPDNNLGRKGAVAVPCTEAAEKGANAIADAEKRADTVSVCSGSRYPASYPAALKVVYNRVGKAGSTTMAEAIKRLLPPGVDVGVNHRPYMKQTDALSSAIAAVKTPGVYMDHEFIHAELLARADHAWINVVREPLDRAQSLF